MMGVFRLIVLIASVTIPALAFAQAAGDTVATDTIRNKFVPTGVRIGADLISPIKSYFQDNYEGWEFQGDIDFSRYFFTLEYGHWERDHVSESATYGNSGNYWRAGIDINFLTKDPERNVFFLGGRYGRSVFSESMSVQRTDPIWGELSDTFYHSGVNASWIELTAGLKVRVWKIFWLAYTGRLKFALSTKGSQEMLAYDVPGFGRTDKETTWGFNYYLVVRLPIRKSPPVPGATK